MKKLSFVIPAKNEEKSLPKLYKEIVTVVSKITMNFEIIFIDDGSTDKTYEVIKNLIKKDKKVKLIRHRGNWGKSIALQNGFQLAKGDIIFTLDADLQDDPQEITKFLKKLDEGYDLVSGWKKERHDSIHTVIFSRVLNNFLIPQLTGIKIHDTNCGFKVYKREVVESLNLYGELYRYIPIIVARNNFSIAEIPINHRKRLYGKSKYNITKNIKGFLDLITIVFLTKYLKRPGHFFGTAGLMAFGSGFIVGIYILYIRITTGGINYHQPLLMFGLLLMIIGIQLISTGLIGEMMTSFNQNKDSLSSVIKEIIPSRKS